MSHVLVTGATGRLGRVVAQRLGDGGGGDEIRSLSRGGGIGLVSADLLTGRGLDSAISGVDTVIHCATGKNDSAQARMLVEAARAAKVSHFVLVSIVGIDSIPFGYYRQKLEVERIIEESGIPFTVLRATQFHPFIEDLFAAQKWSPFIFAPAFSAQPIDVSEVASRLVDLARGVPAGRVEDLGGPQSQTLPELARLWARRRGVRRAVVPLRLPGKTFRAFRAGNNLTPATPTASITFEQYLENS